MEKIMNNKLETKLTHTTFMQNNWTRITVIVLGVHFYVFPFDSALLPSYPETKHTPI